MGATLLEEDRDLILVGKLQDSRFHFVGLNGVGVHEFEEGFLVKQEIRRILA